MHGESWGVFLKEGEEEEEGGEEDVGEGRMCGDPPCERV